MLGPRVHFSHPPQGERTALCRPFPAALSGCGPRPGPAAKAAAGREGGNVFPYGFCTVCNQPPRQAEWRPWGLCRLLHPKLRGKHALRRRSGWPAHRGQESFPPPARCTRAFCFAKPRLPPAGVCLPAASGHFASQNRACLRQGSACPPHAGILLRKTAPASGRSLLARCKRAFCFAKPQNPLFSKNQRGCICRTSIRRKCPLARPWPRRPLAVFNMPLTARRRCAMMRPIFRYASPACLCT